jgi:hypothetical protein
MTIILGLVAGILAASMIKYSKHTKAALGTALNVLAGIQVILWLIVMVLGFITWDEHVLYPWVCFTIGAAIIGLWKS